MQPIKSITTNSPHRPSITAMVPKITAATNMTTGTAHIHSRSKNIPKLGGWAGSPAAPRGPLLLCSILFIRKLKPSVPWDGGHSVVPPIFTPDTAGDSFGR